MIAPPDREPIESQGDIEGLKAANTAANAARMDAEGRLSTSRAENDQLRSDIADQKVLFREVHHRIKNNLQILNSLVTIIGLRFSDPAVASALGELQDRISSISLVHELLYRKGEASVIDLADYLQAVAESVWAANGAAEKGLALTVRLDLCLVDMDTAVSLGLLLTEVLTNAIKHAFPAGQAGAVTLSLDRPGDRMRLTVKDNGVGHMPANTSGRGIGLGLVRSLASQLNGEIAVASVEGSSFELTVPA